MQNLMANARIVLVNTSHPGNIGGVARAMKNMGIHNLVLVDPQEFPSGKADARSAGAKDVLANARVVNTLAQALEGCGLVVGTSARSRNIPWPLLDPRQTAAQALS
ncbi:MAG: tRNA (cytosine(32)/uridine(32)-2'-O)-methyltransferase TrmJ, partial [Oceanospirillaceae bacterium]|nr:tRNA (cytosine(32)/uridine(32)-2'-O)-methyltransferase TrmJ [Oceanospirillaceae bacterium]